MEVPIRHFNDEYWEEEHADVEIVRTLILRLYSDVDRFSKRLIPATYMQLSQVVTGELVICPRDHEQLLEDVPMTVLVVSGDSFVRMALEASLGCSFRVVSVPTLVRTMDVLLLEPVDVLLLDASIPIPDDLDLDADLQSLRPALAVVRCKMEVSEAIREDVFARACGVTVSPEMSQPVVQRVMRALVDSAPDDGRPMYIEVRAQ